MTVPQIGDLIVDFTGNVYIANLIRNGKVIATRDANESEHREFFLSTLFSSRPDHGIWEERRFISRKLTHEQM